MREKKKHCKIFEIFVVYSISTIVGSRCCFTDQGPLESSCPTMKSTSHRGVTGLLFSINTNLAHRISASTLNATPIDTTTPTIHDAAHTASDTPISRLARHPPPRALQRAPPCPSFPLTSSKSATHARALTPCRTPRTPLSPPSTS